MSGSVLIDGHTHLFPDEAYGRSWQEQAGHQAIRSGTVPELDACMRRGGIEQAVILLYPRSREFHEELRSVWGDDATEEELRLEVVEGIRRLNRWGCDLSVKDSRFIPFVGVNPRFMRSEEMTAEIEELVPRGARGVKLIPPAMQLYANDPLLSPVYGFCLSRSLPVLSQSGSGGIKPTGHGVDPFGRPAYFGDVLTSYPKLTLILAHMGLGYEDEVCKLVHAFPRVYTDTSLRLGNVQNRYDAGNTVDIIRNIGTSRVIFGSNFPLADPTHYAETIRRLPFSREEQRRLFSGNLLESLDS